VLELFRLNPIVNVFDADVSVAETVLKIVNLSGFGWSGKPLNDATPAATLSTIEYTYSRISPLVDAL